MVALESTKDGDGERYRDIAFMIHLESAIFSPSKMKHVLVQVKLHRDFVNKNCIIFVTNITVYCTMCLYGHKLWWC